MKIAHVVVLLALAACSKKDPTGETKATGSAASASGLTCAAAVGKAVEAMSTTPGAEAVVTKLRALMTNRCEADKWSAAALECYATQVKDMSGMKKCRETTLTPAQNTAVMTEIRATMAAAAGGGGGPMHGAPAGSAVPQ
ncbi:MAG: hypothetical protein WKG01_18705 [Kofleriaceae bacterium]